MTEKVKKSKKDNDFDRKINELTADLQRTRADFENYRKRIDLEKNQAREAGKLTAILQVLPIIDNIERAICFVPEELSDNKWAQGIVALMKNLEKSLDNLNLKRIEAKPGMEFNPELHNAVQFDEAAAGEKEVIAEELMPGYCLEGIPIRHAMVKVTRK